MSNVCKLINYNFYAAKKSIFMAIGIFGIMWLITILTSFQFIALLPPACAAMVFESVFINENKNNAKKVMGILPIKRYEYVLSRYILLTITAVVFAFISYGIIKLSNHISLFEMSEALRINVFANNTADIVVSYAGIALCIGLSLGALHFFCHFVFSEDKANLAITAGVIIIMVGIPAALYFVSGDIETMLATLNKLPFKMADNPNKFAGTAVLIGIAADIFFCILSVVIVNRKEI